jgi:NTE family protein
MVPAPVSFRLPPLLLAAALALAAGAAGAERPRIGLALGGGGARGVAHIGVLKELERMRIPVDCIAGTSMGALVGGVYASGVTTDAMIDRLSRVDWSALFVDDPPREQKPFRAKSDDTRNLFQFELGLRDGSLQLPPGGTAGYKFEFLLRELVAGAGNFADQDFDRLPIPYRALATDIEDGTSKVFRRGDLAKVMRASMSVPGAIAPVEIGGSLYVDGGLLQNLPVAAAREACADVVIAVNVGSGLLERRQLSSALNISLQMINVLMEQNVRQSLASLKPSDVLIAPVLGSYSAANFEQALSLVETGEVAARAQAIALSRLAVPEADYAAWRRRVAARLPVVPPVTDVRVATDSGRVNPEVIERELAEVPGIDLRRRPETDFSPTNLHSRLEQVYGSGDFERMDYEMLDRDGQRTVVVKGHEKSWGPDFLKFGLTMEADSSQTRFNVAVSHRAPWMNRLGGEWRNYLQLGYRDRFSTEFYQPVSFRAGAFVAPRFTWRRDPEVFFFDGHRVGEVDVQTARGHLDFGLQNKYGEVRLGYFGGRLQTKQDFGLVSVFQDEDIRQSGLIFSAVFDQIDSPTLPQDGLLLSFRSFNTYASLGSDDDYNKTELLAMGAKSFGRHALQLAGYYGDSLRGKLPIYDPFFLGGFLRGSGYAMDELVGTAVSLVRTVYTYRLSSLPATLGKGVYLGGSLEGTRGAVGLDPAAESQTRGSASIFLGADTIFGTMYFAFGQVLNGDQRPHTFYLMVGTP